MSMESIYKRVEGRQPINKRVSLWKCTSVMGSNESLHNLNLDNDKDANQLNLHDSNICMTKSVTEKMDAIFKSGQSDAQDVENGNISKNHELQNLKDLLLLNLELIQQQHATINEKEQQITTLQNENNALNSRLERMERRISILRQKEFETGSSHTHATPEKIASYVPAGGPHFPGDSSTSHYSRISKKRPLPSPEAKVAPALKESTADVPSQPVKRLKQSEESPAKALQKHKRSTPRAEMRASDRVLSESEEAEPGTTVVSPTSQRARGESDVYRTRRNYFVQEKCVDVEDSLEVAEITNKKEDHINENENNAVETATPSILVPTWRVTVIPTGYNMEGTENLDDEIYLKRHSRPEMEEKRRKRWDMQRIRELQMYEKLQGGRSASVSISTTSTKLRPTPTSPIKLDPCLDDVKYIEICDEVAVNAFGSAIPTFTSSEFTLPWYDGAKVTNKNKTPLRGRRK